MHLQVGLTTAIKHTKKKKKAKKEEVCFGDYQIKILTMFASRVLRTAPVCQVFRNVIASRYDASFDVCRLMSGVTSAALRRSFLKQKYKVFLLYCTTPNEVTQH